MEPSVQPPERFGVVAPQLYRSSVFHPVNFTFVHRLQLKTVVHLSPEVTLRAVNNFIRENNIRLIHLGIKSWKPTSGWKPMNEELVKEALEIILDVRNHPIMLMCTSGVHQTGTVVGCLRRIQRFSFTSIIDELRRFAFPAHTRYTNENFIEFFDTDLVSLPEHLPDWFVRQLRYLPTEPLLIQNRAALAAASSQGPEGDSASLHQAPAYQRYLGTNVGPLVEGEAAADSKKKKKKDKEGDKPADEDILQDGADPNAADAGTSGAGPDVKLSNATEDGEGAKPDAEDMLESEARVEDDEKDEDVVRVLVIENSPPQPLVEEVPVAIPPPPPNAALSRSESES